MKKETNETSSPPLKQRLFSYLQKTAIKILDIRLKDLSDLKDQIKQAKQSSLINHDTFVMLEGVLKIDDLRVREVMIPMPSMRSIEIASSVDEVQQIISSSLYSRYPIIDDGKPIGLLYVKDLVNFLFKRLNPLSHDTNKDTDSFSDFNLKELTRQFETVPESTKLSVLLQQFRDGRNHFALVVDEHKELVGLITIKDVLEQVVGEIRYEYYDDEVTWILDHERQSTVRGLTPLEIFNSHFQCNFSSTHGETVAGLIISYCEKLPLQGEKIQIEHLIFKILKADNRRIYFISVKKRPPSDDERLLTH